MLEVIWYISIARFFLKVISVPFKLSALHATTLFKGWIPVAEAMAITWLQQGIELGKYPQNPPDRVMSTLMTNAHMTIGAGALFNLWFLVMFIWLAT